jgi:predicted AAA+ superfamily ATPase
MYPDIIINPGQEKEFLKNLTESYLYKDILALGNIKKPDVLERLLQALAYQIGSEVSYNELSMSYIENIGLNSFYSVRLKKD